MNSPETSSEAEYLSTALRSEVLVDEPPFDLSTRGWHESGVKAVRRRRARVLGVAVAATVVAAVVAAATLVPRLEGGDSDLGSDIPAAAQQTLDDFNPATFPSVVDAEVRSGLAGAIPSSVTGRVEPTYGGYARLRPEDYSFGNAWTATYQLSATDRVTVILQRDQATNEGSAKRYCHENLAADSFDPFDRCAVAELPDGSVSIMSVKKTLHTPAGFTRVRAKDTPDTWWYVRQVFNRRDYGYGVVAREAVKASSLAEADSKWTASVAGLGAVASSPALVFPSQPAKKDCQVGYKVPKSEDDFINIVCLDPGQG